jgi:hypothetical protein
VREFALVPDVPGQFPVLPLGNFDGKGRDTDRFSTLVTRCPALSLDNSLYFRLGTGIPAAKLAETPAPRTPPTATTFCNLRCRSRQRLVLT